MTKGTEALQAAECGRGAVEGGRSVRRARALLLVLAASATAASVTVGWACRASAGGGGMNAPAAPAAQAQADPLITTLTATGFSPNQLSRAAGHFNLRVRNQSGLREAVLRLSNSAGEKVTEVKLTEKVRDWTAPVELAAGAYTLSEVAHPEWTCRLEVTPQ
ncbi:MAG: hypothetical protein JOZ02_04220 [Acidobacteria bacterium]|nr:hypothetical protein [Acidobacteriota bacterium]